MDSALLLLFLWALMGMVSLQSSEQCPERLQGQERRKSCPRSCRSDKDCASKRQCLCDGQCGLSCVAPGRTCPWPLPLSETSEVRLLSPSPAFSALLEVRCRPGFTSPSSGSDVTVRRCQGDRQWSGDELICTGGSERYLRVHDGELHTEQMENIRGKPCGIVPPGFLIPCLNTSNRGGGMSLVRLNKSDTQERNPSVAQSTQTLHNCDLFSPSPWQPHRSERPSEGFAAELVDEFSKAFEARCS